MLANEGTQTEKKKEREDRTYASAHHPCMHTQKAEKKRQQQIYIVFFFASYPFLVPSVDLNLQGRKQQKEGMKRATKCPRVAKQNKQTKNSYRDKQRCIVIRSFCYKKQLLPLLFSFILFFVHQSMVSYSPLSDVVVGALPRSASCFVFFRTKGRPENKKSVTQKCGRRKYQRVNDEDGEGCQSQNRSVRVSVQREKKRGKERKQKCK